MPASDPSESNPPQRPKPARRDPRLDAKPPAPGQRPAPRSVAPEKPTTPKPAIDVGSKASGPVRKSNKSVVWVIAGVVVLVVLAVGGWAVFSNKQPQGPGGGPTTAKEDQPQADPGEVSELREPTRPIKVRINTPEPGFVAFIDEQAVHDDKGQVVLTPCEVTVERGKHVIRVAKKGWNDTPREVEITEKLEVDQEPVYEPFAETGTTFTAPYLNAQIGEPILLQTLVFKGRCQDPFVSANGLEIWYAASGPEGMGIYYSTRATAYDEWETPALLVLSRGADLPASPSATVDGLLVAYTVPGRPGRVWGLTRKAPEEAFDDKDPLHHLEHGEADWPVAQLSATGTRLYWYEVRNGKTSSWKTTRDDRQYPFSEGKKVPLPGGIPCLSADELRQYLFDGKQLSRARRTKSTGSFTAPQVIAEVNLATYVPHPERRQFWVTDDEQWLYYAEDPATSGNLYTVRLSAGPGRGVAVRGRSLKVESTVVAKTDQPEKPDVAIKPDMEEKPQVDPRSLPTAYAAAQQRLGELLAKRDLAAAAQWVAEQQKKPELKAQRQLLDWDADEVAQVQALWKVIESEADKLKPGDTIRIGGSGFTLEKYADGVFTLKTKTKTVERKLTELSAGDLLVLADKSIAKTDADGQFRIGIFLHYEGKSQAQASKTRMDRAEDAAAADFREHLAVRRLKIIEEELARENLSVAIGLIDELALAFPKSPSTTAAEQHRAKIYSYVKWEPRGSRKWEQGEDGSYTTTSQKALGSLLVSSSDYDSFDLSLEWKITSPTGQGGVYFRYPGQGKPLDTAFKIQLANDAGVAPDKFCTGSLFNYYPPSENAAKVGIQWSTLTMQVRGEKITATINGKKVMETLATDPAVPVRGFVALDGEIGGIAYRKILLVEGPKVATPAAAARK